MPSPAKLLASASGASVDPNFRNVTLLLHGDGSNGAQNNTFIDGSTNNFTITRNGNTTQGSFSPYGSRWSNYFDGNGDYLTVPASSAFAFGTGDFTVEGWVYLNVITSTYAKPMAGTHYYSAGTGDRGWGFGLSSTGNPILFMFGSSGTGYTLTAPNPVPVSTWTHLAVSRSGTTIKIFVNGVEAVSGTSGYNEDYTGAALKIATDEATSVSPSIGNSGFSINGYLSDLRIVKGTAVYTSAFTPPITPLTAISGTSLLTCQSNRFRDASTNNFAITANGNVAVLPFSPYAPTAPYSAATNGGSMYFDGNGDYLTTPSSTAFNLGGGDCTAECWVNFSSTANVPHIFEIGDSAVNRGVVYQTGGYIRLWNVSDRIVSNILISPNVWYHVAVSRVSGTYTLYVNGISQGTYASTIFPNVTSELHVGFQAFTGTSADYFNGYISNLRVVKGTAVYTANFTPPTAPVTAITNTSLLLNGTNAGIVDSSADNDLETVGNAQISTSVKKFGTGSVYFDGNGDSLNFTGGDPIAFGTGDFTIELWAYLTNTGTFSAFLRADDAGNFPDFGYDFSAGQLKFDARGTAIVSVTTSMPTSQWAHVAVCRSGTNLRLFINGTQVGTTTTNSTNFGLSTGVIRIGGSSFSATHSVNGYIDDLRITKGVARYTANFTPPTAAFPDQ